MSRRVIVYGDIHGCLDELKKLRKKIKPKNRDIEISVGDFVNKGPKSIETLRYIQKKGILSVVGNNEVKIMKFYKEFQKKGDEFFETLRNFEQHTLSKMTMQDYHFLKTLPYFYKIKNLTILHGGIPNGVKLKKIMNKKEKEELTLMRYLDKDYRPIPYKNIKDRSSFWSEVYNGREGFIVFGHHPFEKPKIEDHAIGIDTGAVYGGKLSAIVFNQNSLGVDVKNYKIYSVKSKKDYFSDFSE